MRLPLIYILYSISLSLYLSISLSGLRVLSLVVCLRSSFISITHHLVRGVLWIRFSPRCEKTDGA